MSNDEQSLFRRLIPWFVVLLYLTLVQWLVGWGAIIEAWQAVGITGFLLGLALMLLSYFARIRRNYEYFRPETSGQFRAVARITVVHNMLNQLLPMRSGELSFPLFMKREFQLGYARSGTGLLWFRLLDLHTLVSFGLLMFLVSHQPALLVWILWSLLTVVPLVVFLLRDRLEEQLERSLSPGKVKSLLDGAMTGLPDGRAMFVGSWWWTVLNWTAKFAALMGLMYQFVPAPIEALALGVISGELTSVLPIHTPGGVGSYEAGIAAGLSLFTFDHEQLLTAAVNIHLFILSLASLLGLLGLLAAPSRGKALSSGS